MSLVWNKLIRPAFFSLDAERAHELGMEFLRRGLATALVSTNKADATCGPVARFGLQFPNPIGMAAGFDKNGIVVDRLAELGFGFVEVGTVTAEPQPGNPKPRLFRLPDDAALINRLGFNNDGAVAIADRLIHSRRNCIIGVNIGKNKDIPIEDAAENYLECLDAIHGAADYIAVNVSSPNTPGLRELQHGRDLEDLLAAIGNRNRELGEKPLLIKIAPDLTEGDIENIVGVAIDKRLAGLIATNTTIERAGLRSPTIAKIGAGGLSGKPLAARSNVVIATAYKYSKGKLPIIGVGGIFTAEDAFEKVAAGASLIQAYTGFIYRGPSFAVELDRDLQRMIVGRGFHSYDEAVGTSVA